jgi:flagellar basal-body rod protein FlgF
MDKLLYVAMTGAKETLRAQAANNHNIANASTTGFRADMSAFQSRAVTGPGFDSRVYATNGTTGWDSDLGAQVFTGRELDVAINGQGFIAVQGRDGREAYTRAGDLRIDQNGQLLTATGHPVLGDGGPLSVPPHTSLAVAGDGTISIVPLGQGPETTATVGRIKTVNPTKDQLDRGEDGLFRMRDGTDAPPDPNVQIASGSLESSNVNIADAMVQMIELQRHFELQVKAMRTAEENAAASTQLLRST